MTLLTSQKYPQRYSSKYLPCHYIQADLNLYNYFCKHGRPTLQINTTGVIRTLRNIYGGAFSRKKLTNKCSIMIIWKGSKYITQYTFFEYSVTKGSKYFKSLKLDLFFFLVEFKLSYNLLELKRELLTGDFTLLSSKGLTLQT